MASRLTTLLLFIGLLSLTNCSDKPTRLSDKSETIEVSYVNWACSCADFIETKYYKDKVAYETREEDCIYIEPARLDLKVPESFYNKDHFKKHLRLTGHFYIDKGVPDTYDAKTPERPNKAEVFLYDKMEFVNK